MTLTDKSFGSAVSVGRDGVSACFAKFVASKTAACHRPDMVATWALAPRHLVLAICTRITTRIPVIALKILYASPPTAWSMVQPCSSFSQLHTFSSRFSLAISRTHVLCICNHGHVCLAYAKQSTCVRDLNTLTGYAARISKRAQSSRK